MSALTPLPDPPSTNDPVNFNTRADAFLGALPQFVTEANAYEASLRAAATPGGVVLPFTFISGTSGDPGAGNIRLNNATQNGATALLSDVVDALGIDRTTTLANMGASTNPVKGSLRISKAGDGSKFLEFDLTGATNSSGYYTLAVTCKAFSSPSPFTAGDNVVVTFVRSGDVGATGPVAAWTLIGTTNVTGSPAAVTISGLPQTYSEMAFNFDIPSFTSGSPSPLQMATSNNGSTFTNYALFGTTTTGFRGLVQLVGYRLDDQIAQAGYQSGGSPNLSITPISGSTVIAFRTDGGVAAVRFAAQGATFANGTIKTYGR